MIGDWFGYGYRFTPPSPQARAWIFEQALRKYIDVLVRLGRVPASREVVLEEARRGLLDPVALLERKMATLTP